MTTREQEDRRLGEIVAAGTGALIKHLIKQCEDLGYSDKETLFSVKAQAEELLIKDAWVYDNFTKAVKAGVIPVTHGTAKVNEDGDIISLHYDKENLNDTD